MKPKEVIMMTLTGELPERVPAALMGGGMWSVYHHGANFEDLSVDAVKMSDMLVEMAGVLQSDIVYVGSGYPNFPVAALGGKMKFREIGVPDLEAPIVTSGEDIAKLDLSLIDGDRVLNTIREAFKITNSKIGKDYIVSMTAWGPFTRGARLVGEETLIKAVLKRPSFVESILAFASELLVRLFEPLVSEGEIELITLGDPTASGDIISRKHFERFALPYIRKFTDWAKSRGVSTLLHICGDTTDRLDLYPHSGADCISLDQKTDIRKAKEVLHGRMCFAGNIDPVTVMLQGTTREVEDTCRKVIEAVGTEGGFVLMPGCDIPPTIPYENIRKFMQIARAWKL
jgi:uroporphyrinogen decarboxylase